MDIRYNNKKNASFKKKKHSFFGSLQNAVSYFRWQLLTSELHQFDRIGQRIFFCYKIIATFHINVTFTARIGSMKMASKKTWKWKSIFYNIFFPLTSAYCWVLLSIIVWEESTMKNINLSSFMSLNPHITLRCTHFLLYFFFCKSISIVRKLVLLNWGYLFEIWNLQQQQEEQKKNSFTSRNPPLYNNLHKWLI